MNTVNAVALALYFVQLLAFAVALLLRASADLRGHAILFGGHALVSGLFVVCVLGGSGTLPYQQQRGSSVTKVERGFEIAFSIIGGLPLLYMQAISWALALDLQ